MQETVSTNRQAYIGGSDIAIIMGISPFKTRWQLLREKAGLDPIEEVTNKYIEYGNAMEGKIRNYISDITGLDFVEGKGEEEGDPIGFREHTDGESEETVVEIKTTGGNVDRNVYLVQLLWYMHRRGKDKGILGVYARPEDFREKFEPWRLDVTFVTWDEENWELLEKIKAEVDKFILDLKALKENPDMTEQDLLPSEVSNMTEKILALESRLSEIKAEETRIKEEKAKLFDKMVEFNVKKWETPNGYLITRVDPIPPSMKQEKVFDTARFKQDNPELYSQYEEVVDKPVSGRAGYVKITPPKEGKK